MLCEVSIFCESTDDPMTEFQHELSAWVPGGVANTYRGKGDLLREKYTGVEETRTVTTEGLQSPVHGYLNVQPPKYPPARLTGYRCDDSIIATINGTNGYLVYTIDTVDPADYDSLLAVMKGMKPDDPIKDDTAPGNIWTKLSTGLVTITPAENQAQMTTVLNNWRTANPLGTAREFAVALRNFTS